MDRTETFPFEPNAAESSREATGEGDNRPDHSSCGRRQFLLASIGLLLTGCGVQKSTTTLPGPSWRVRQTPIDTPTYEPRPAPRRPIGGGDSGHMIARASWSPGTALPARMQPMNGIRYITVHHDGIGAFYEHDERASRERLESIRRFHRDDRGWGDIGYHYVIDRQGRIWEGRSVAYQGAHVGNHNEHNVGVMLMGHFEQQSPSERQLAAMQDHVSWLMRRYNVPIGRVFTHREWETARTICPGHSLQVQMDRVRRRGQLG